MLCHFHWLSIEFALLNHLSCFFLFLTLVFLFSFAFLSVNSWFVHCPVDMGKKSVHRIYLACLSCSSHLSLSGSPDPLPIIIIIIVVSGASCPHRFSLFSLSIFSYDFRFIYKAYSQFHLPAQFSSAFPFLSIFVVSRIPYLAVGMLPVLIYFISFSSNLRKIA